MNTSVDLPAPSSVAAARYTLVLLTCAAALFYFQWRLGVMNPSHMTYSWIVFAAELIGFARALMFLLSAVRLWQHHEPAAPPAGLTVDVLIPTCGEPLDVVRRTLMGALAIGYPHETWLLDDAGRSEVHALAAECGGHYVARDRHNDAKAGNLNHALASATGEFVMVLDADHVADRRILDRTLGYFEDPRLAFVQTPQEFFNVDSFDHLNPRRTTSNGGSFFQRVVQRSRGASNTTLYVGSAAVFRRSALDGVGGFAIGTISEDVHTSLRLHAAGWRSMFHPEILSAGMGALDAPGYYRQRLRWSQDVVQVLMRANPIVYPGLTRAQRLTYVIHIASNLEGWRHAFIYALPIAILITGVVPLQAAPVAFLAHFMPYLLVSTLACIELSRGHLRPEESAVYNLARCTASLTAPFTAHGERRWFVTDKARQPARHRVGSRFPWIVLLATTAAVAYAGAAMLAGRSPLSAGTLAIVGVWGAYNALTAGRLLLLERRCARERRSQTRFGENLVATIRPVDDRGPSHEVEAVVASAGGFTVRPRGDTNPPPPGSYAGAVRAENGTFRFTLELRDAGGALRWPDAATRAAFDLMLHQRAVRRFAETDRGDSAGLFG